MHLTNIVHATLQILDKIVHAILHRINHSHEHIPSAVNAPGGAVMSVSAGSKSNPLARCHGVCVSDLGNILGQLEQEGRDLGLETGWEDGVSGDASTMNLDVDLSDESGNSKAAPEAACKADVDPDVEFGKALYKVKDNNGRVPKTVESFNETCGSSSMDINLEIGHGVEFRQTLYKVKDSNDRVCKSGYSERGSVGSASLDLDLDVESREPRRSARNARTLYKVTDKNGRVCKTVQSDDEKEDVDFDEGDKVMDKLSKTVCRTGRSKIDEKPNAKEGKKKKAHITFDESSSDALRKSREEEEKVQRRHLMQTSLQTALAITIHNFPEGLATFVAAMSDPKVGFVLAIAIAVHNIRKYARILASWLLFALLFSHTDCFFLSFQPKDFVWHCPSTLPQNQSGAHLGMLSRPACLSPLRPCLLGSFWATRFRMISMQSCLDLLLE